MSQNLINICADIDNFCQIYSSSWLINYSL
jgi:hypothetical protein